MTLSRHTWRYLAAILMIVAFAMPSTVHAHVTHASAGHAHGPTPVTGIEADHAALPEVGQVESGHLGDPTKVKAHAACCAACACCSALPTASVPAFARFWRPLRLGLGTAEVTPPSRPPEALPEPPRSFA